MTDNVKRQEFRLKVLPHLEVLMQLSLSLTRNGRDAIRLLREAISEASPLVDQWKPAESCDIRLYEILTRRFFSGFQLRSRPLASIREDSPDTGTVPGALIAHSTMTFPREDSSLGIESDEHLNFYRAILGLPSVCRSAMILSYLEGFSNSEIADLARAQSHTIESLLNRGCGLLRNELFEVLLSGQSVDAARERAARSA